MIHILHLLWIIPLSVSLGVCLGVAEAINDFRAEREEGWDYE